MLALATIHKLGKLFPRLASNHDGEVVATARAIIRTLDSAGASLHDLAAEMQPKVRVEERVVYRDAPKPKKSRKKDPPPEPPRSEPSPRGKFVPFQQILDWAPHLVQDCKLNEREIAFVEQLAKWAKAHREKLTLTERQAEWWRRLLVENDITQPEGSAA